MATTNTLGSVERSTFAGAVMTGFALGLREVLEAPRDDQIVIETEHPEFREWRWIAPGDMLARIVPFKRDVYARVLDEFGPLV